MNVTPIGTNQRVPFKANPKTVATKVVESATDILKNRYGVTIGYEKGNTEVHHLGGIMKIYTDGEGQEPWRYYLSGKRSPESVLRTLTDNGHIARWEKEIARSK